MSKDTTTTKPVGNNGSNRKLTKPEAAQPAPAPVDPTLRLTVAQLMADIMASGEYEFEIPDDFLAGKLTERIKRLEARVAELEQAAGKPAVAARADAAALAGKGAK